MNHGTHSCYKHHGCRCELCKQAFRDYQNELNRRNREMRGSYDFQRFSGRRAAK